MLENLIRHSVCNSLTGHTNPVVNSQSTADNQIFDSNSSTRAKESIENSFSRPEDVEICEESLLRGILNPETDVAQMYSSTQEKLQYTKRPARSSDLPSDNQNKERQMQKKLQRNENLKSKSSGPSRANLRRMS